MVAQGCPHRCNVTAAAAAPTGNDHQPNASRAKTARLPPSMIWISKKMVTGQSLTRAANKASAIVQPTLWTIGCGERAHVLLSRARSLLLNRCLAVPGLGS